jgi:hypothetical protein
LSVSNPTRQARGFAWYVSPVGDPPGRAARPFVLGTPDVCETSLRPRAYWPVGTAYAGLLNADAGSGFLALTLTATPPAAGTGWAVEPARFDGGCVADGGNLRVTSVAAAAPGCGADEPWECVFEVSEG